MNSSLLTSAGSVLVWRVSVHCPCTIWLLFFFLCLFIHIGNVRLSVCQCPIRSLSLPQLDWHRSQTNWHRFHAWFVWLCHQWTVILISGFPNNAFRYIQSSHSTSNATDVEHCMNWPRSVHHLFPTPHTPHSIVRQHYAIHRQYFFPSLLLHHFFRPIACWPSAEFQASHRSSYHHKFLSTLVHLENNEMSDCCFCVLPLTLINDYI